MRVLVTGAKGMLGTDLVKRARLEEWTIIETDIEELDITDINRVCDFILCEKPDAVINCAAYTQVEKAEEEKEKAFLINAAGVKNIVLACKEFKVPICHISTDYVFDGNKRTPYLPEDKPNPINTYGASKYQGERYLIDLYDKHYLVRTSWLYGLKGNNFVFTILELCKNRDEIKVVNDQIGAPTWTVNLSEAIIRIIRNGIYGIYHYRDEVDTGISWYDFAKEIIKLSNARTKVVPITTKDYPTRAKRPLYSLLDITKTKLLLSDKIPYWKNALNNFLKLLDIIKEG